MLRNRCAVRTLTGSDERALAALNAAFAHERPDLGDFHFPNCADTRFHEVQKLIAKGEANWSPADIDWLFFKSMTTVGSEQTVKYAFVRFVVMMLRDEYLGPASTYIIPDKLDYAGFANWPDGQQRAALNALIQLAEVWSADEGYESAAVELRDFITTHDRQSRA